MQSTSEPRVTCRVDLDQVRCRHASVCALQTKPELRGRQTQQHLNCKICSSIGQIINYH